MNLNISKLLLIPLKSKCTDKIASLFQVIFMEFSFYLKGFMTGPYVDLNLRENNSILITIYINVLFPGYTGCTMTFLHAWDSFTIRWSLVACVHCPNMCC